MKILESLRLDAWWKVILYCGVSLILVGLIFDIQIVNPRILIGIGVGMFIVGMANFAVFKNVSIPHGMGLLQTKKTIHNKASRIASVLGWLITVYFTGLLLWSLSKDVFD